MKNYSLLLLLLFILCSCWSGHDTRHSDKNGVFYAQRALISSSTDFLPTRQKQCNQHPIEGYVVLTIVVATLLIFFASMQFRSYLLHRKEKQLLLITASAITAFFQLLSNSPLLFSNTQRPLLYYLLGVIILLLINTALCYSTKKEHPQKFCRVVTITLFVLFTIALFTTTLASPLFYTVIICYSAYTLWQLLYDKSGWLKLFIGTLFILFSISAIADTLLFFSPCVLSYHFQYITLALLFSLITPVSKKYAGCFKSEEKLTEELAIKSAKLVKANFDLKVLNQNLEQTVDVRTGEYKNALSSVEATLRELEKAHASIEHDLLMASNVQRLYFREQIPRVNGWEIAFIYKPKHRVSGDMYDFYIDNNQLLGASLFDVSGHGVQSALITMLAKNLISELFYKLYEKPAGTILEIINKRLIEEIGNMDNYITGLLIKLNNTNIEVANASHANILHRSFVNNSVRELKPKRSKGNFLGISVMDEPYNTDTYLIDTDDSLLLYSDGLYEYKQDGILLSRSFSSIQENFMKCKKHQSAHSQLDFILREYSFDKKENTEDDLTVILMRKIRN